MVFLNILKLTDLISGTLFLCFALINKMVFLIYLHTLRVLLSY